MEDKEEKILLQISVDDEGTRVKFETHSADEMFRVCIALAQLINQHEVLDAGIGTLMDAMNNCPEFAKDLEESTVDLQALKQFKDILKN